MTHLQDLAAALAESKETQTLLQLAIREDIGSGDVTTLASVPPGTQASAKIIARQSGVVCGFPILQQVIKLQAAQLTLEVACEEGSRIEKGETMARLCGAADAILTLERTLLNFLQRLSGIATVTRLYVDAAGKSKAQILETRKTIPGWRGLDKYAVVAGGGAIHRQGLYDQILAKENHFALMPAADFVGKLKHLKGHAPSGIKIEVEVENLDEVKAALEEEIELILLDNMSLDDMRGAVALRNALPAACSLLEASGGITLASIPQVAATGVDRISVGALTHSVQAFDLSLLIEF